MSITQNSPFNLDSDARKFSFTIIFPVPLNITIIPYMNTYYPFTLDSIIAKTASGSVNITVKKVHNSSTTIMEDADNIPLGTLKSTITPTSGNSLSVDDSLLVTFSNATNCTILHLQFNCTEDFKQT